MTLCVNHVTLPTVKCKYPKKTVRLISSKHVQSVSTNICPSRSSLHARVLTSCAFFVTLVAVDFIQ